MVEARQWRGQGRQVLQVFQPENFICVLVSISFYQCQLVHIYSKAGQIASAPRAEDCIGCKRCETACPTDFLSVRVYLGAETTRSLGLTY